MRRQRMASLIALLVLGIALNLLSLSYPLTAQAYNVLTTGQTQVDWNTAPQAHSFAVDPNLNSKLFVQVDPGVYANNQLVDPVGHVINAANTWNSASRFRFSYTPNYTENNLNVSFVTAADLNFSWTNACGSANNNWATMCGTFDGNVFKGGKVYLNNTTQVTIQVQDSALGKDVRCSKTGANGQIAPFSPWVASREVIAPIAFLPS
jgi:hypothetical protein